MFLHLAFDFMHSKYLLRTHSVPNTTQGIGDRTKMTFYCLKSYAISSFIRKNDTVAIVYGSTRY